MELREKTKKKRPVFHISEKIMKRNNPEETKNNGSNGSHKKIRILDDQQLKFWNENGYLIIENFISNEECETLKKRATELVDSFFESPDANVKSVFTTVDQEKVRSF
jgi:hypothetical protein